MNRREFLQNSGVMSASLLAGGKLLAQTGAEPNFPPLPTITVGGQEIRPTAPPRGLHNFPDLGILVNHGMSAQRIYARLPPDDWCGESRCVKTPGGDYLLMLTIGQHHYGGRLTKVNNMVAFRSSDQGKTWSGPQIAWNIPYNQHAFVPFIPSGSTRIYALGTEPIFKLLELPENAPIGYRYSDDDGHTWSEGKLIHPVDDRDYIGIYIMRMCETGPGTWILGPCTNENYREHNQVTTRQYGLRSTDRGGTWTLLPRPRPQGWVIPGLEKLGKDPSMGEGRPISLGGTKVAIFCRTTEGHLWQVRSEDDGLTWTPPQPTTLVHPPAPPMVFHLSDGKTLACFHHNRFTPKIGVIGSGQDRSELWVSTSKEGLTWTEPRFVLANSAGGGTFGGYADWCVSYQDMVADHGVLHLFFSHQFRQALHVWFEEKILNQLPTRRELGL
jgi:hypothetical protein